MRPVSSGLKLALTLLLVGVGILCWGQQPIQAARLEALGTSVTVSGTVLNGQELGSIRYLQDATGGIAAFPGSGSAPGFAAQVQRGDSIVVTGVLVDYNGLLELSPVTSFTVISKGVLLPQPKAISFDWVDDTYESALVHFEGVTFLQPGFFAANKQYSLQDATGEQMPLFIRSGHPLVGKAIPTGALDLTAIVSDFNGFQLLVRDSADLKPAGDLYFTRLVRQTDLSNQTLTLSWATNIPATARLTIEDPAGSVFSDTVTQTALEHTFQLDGLAPATPYIIVVTAVKDALNVPGNKVVASTESEVPGTIDVYFNQPVDPAGGSGPAPLSTSGDEILDALVSLIQEAGSTVDVSIYNINEAAIVQALTVAHNKGVRVRLVAASSTSNSALEPPPPFPVIYGNDNALMHNKFVVVDAEVADKAAVFMGSMNFTTPMIFSHPNNMLLFRDQALARAYTLEFEEMWGASGAFPDESLARFGSDKRDNTPHLFRIGGSLVESYFSPSDNTNVEILHEIQAMEQDMAFALLTFTKDDLADAMVEKQLLGREVRGIIDNINDNGSEYNYLLAGGVNVVDHAPTTILHHKYAVLDASRVVTGSHNWSNAANQVNDENTVIVHDSKVAGQFLQEFEARWSELSTSTEEPRSPGTFQALVAVESPAGVWLRTSVSTDRQIAWQILDAMGRPVDRGSVVAASGDQWHALSLGSLPGGVYLVSLQDVLSGELQTLRFLWPG